MLVIKTDWDQYRGGREKHEASLIRASVSYVGQITSNGSVSVFADSEQSYFLSLSTLQQLLERFDGRLPVGKLPNNKPRWADTYNVHAGAGTCCMKNLIFMYNLL